MTAIDRYRMFETFLRVGEKSTPETSNNTASQGAVNLRMLQKNLLPIVYSERSWSWWCFLLHDRSAGVPVSEDDTGAFIHLRYCLKESYKETYVPPEPWFGTRLMPEQPLESLGDWFMLGRQSQLVVNLIEFYASRSDEELLHRAGAFLHHFQNMLQMKVT